VVISDENFNTSTGLYSFKASSDGEGTGVCDVTIAVTDLGRRYETTFAIGVYEDWPLPKVKANVIEGEVIDNSNNIFSLYTSSSS
jgi:hypothetical protein